MRFHNVIPSKKNGYTKEEMKLAKPKILWWQNDCRYSNCGPVPIVGGSQWSGKRRILEWFDVNEVRNILHHTDGVVVQTTMILTRTQCQCMHKEKMMFSEFVVTKARWKYTLNTWIVVDQLEKRKGQNTIQIVNIWLQPNWCKWILL
jgi:aspartate-semialdehyde dehydrogenase